MTTSAEPAADAAVFTLHVGSEVHEAVAWEWLTVPAQRPDVVVAACTGSPLEADVRVRLALDGTWLDGLTPPQRHRAGLAVVTGRLANLPELRVLDVVLLGLRVPQPPLWQILLGGAKQRSRLDDEEAEARALAGRTGLAAWVDSPATALPADVVALADLTRGLAGAPDAMIWRRPQWLDEEAQARLASVLAAEQDVRGLPVVEVVAPADGSLPAP